MSDGLGQKAITFARGKVGQPVGSGECYDLADKALQNAGAKSAPSYGTITADADYVWGDAVQARDAQPGDVIQFRDYLVTTETTTVTKTRRKDGGGTDGTETKTETSERGHHTALVESNDGDGVLTILEQNVAPLGSTRPVRKVQRNKLVWKGGDRTLPKKIVQGRNGSVTETSVTISVTVQGKLWVYRPKAN